MKGERKRKRGVSQPQVRSGSEPITKPVNQCPCLGTTELGKNCGQVGGVYVFFFYFFFFEC